MQSNKPHVLLTILDGWGINDLNPYEEGNAIELARPSFYRYLLNEFNHTELEASGEAVGVPAGQIGSSEVGHLNIGAGRVVEQEIIKINNEIKSGEFFKNKELNALMEYCNKNNKPLHLMGLLSRGGVHSSFGHIEAVLKLANMKKVEKLYLHAILDGRDVNPKSAKNFLRKFEHEIHNHKDWHIATLIGRFYAMDRDMRLERTKKHMTFIQKVLVRRKQLERCFYKKDMH
jgi:2,3-bisphosphoglycerate-independent phosphoglycerate mutase